MKYNAAIKRTIRILEQHNQDYRIEGDRIIGIAYWVNLDTREEGEEETDLTEYTMKQLYHWLGY